MLKSIKSLIKFLNKTKILLNFYRQNNKEILSIDKVILYLYFYMLILLMSIKIKKTLILYKQD